MTLLSSDQLRPNPVKAQASDSTSLDSVQESSSLDLPRFPPRRSSRLPPPTPNVRSRPSNRLQRATDGGVTVPRDEAEGFVEDCESDETDSEMAVTRSPMLRPTGGQAHVPLL